MTEVEIKGKKFKSEKLKEVEDYILDQIRYWNNFESEEKIVINVIKIETPNTLGVNASDGIKASDLFGRA